MIKHINCRRIYLSMKSTCHNICIIVYISLMKESCTAEFTLHWLRVLRHYYIYKIDLSNWPTSITNSSWDSKFELTLWKLILLVGSWLCWKYGKTEICLWQQSPKAAGVGGRQFSNSSGGVHAEKWKKVLSSGPDSSSGGSSSTGNFGGVWCPDCRVYSYRARSDPWRETW